SFYGEGESVAPNQNTFQDAGVDHHRVSVNSAKSFSSHSKHHSFGYDDRPAGYGEKFESDSESSTSEGAEERQMAERLMAEASASAAASRPTSASSFSIASRSTPSSPVHTRFTPSAVVAENREIEEEEEPKAVESNTAPVVAAVAVAATAAAAAAAVTVAAVKTTADDTVSVVTPVVAPAPAPAVAVALTPDAPVSPTPSLSHSALLVDTISQKSVSTASSIDRREKRYSGSDSDTSGTSIDLHSPTFKDQAKKTPPTVFSRTMSSLSATRDAVSNNISNTINTINNSNNNNNNTRESSAEKTRPTSYATVFSDAEMNDINLADELPNEKRVSEIVPPTPSTPSGFGFGFFGSRNSQIATGAAAATAAAAAAAAKSSSRPNSALTPTPAPVETRSRSTSISALASSVFSGWGFSSSSQNQPPVPPVPRAASQIGSQRASNVGSVATSNRGPNSGPGSDRASIMSNQTTDSNMDLLLARLEAQNELLAQDSKRRATTESEMDRALGHAKEECAGEDYDWDYWGALMHDYNAVVKRDPRKLTVMIQKGVPPALRGLIWQLLAKSKDLQLEGTYAELLKSSSAHEKQITRDMSRTFPNHEYFQAESVGQEALFNVVKAYSLYDPEVGYCQGLSFIVGPLLLN
ncbi:GTPase-activating protein, partial [Entomortierella chlamydospora]